MNWVINYTKKAQKQIKKLSPQYQKRIYEYFDERIREDPYRSDGENLRGTTYAGVFRYRIGDYRALCEIQDELITVLVLEVQHRSKVYGGH